MKFLIGLIILGSNSLPNELDRSTINNSLHDIKSVELDYKDKEGVWFSKTDAEIILNLISDKLILALDIIDNQTLEIDLLKNSIKSYKLSIQQYKNLSDLNLKMYNITMEHISNMEHVEYVWYESSTATFVYGIIIGVSVILLASWVVKNVSGNTFEF